MAPGANGVQKQWRMQIFLEISKLDILVVHGYIFAQLINQDLELLVMGEPFEGLEIGDDQAEYGAVRCGLQVVPLL